MYFTDTFKCDSLFQLIYETLKHSTSSESVRPGVQTKKSPAFWQKSPNLSPQYINKFFQTPKCLHQSFYELAILGKKIIADHL